MQTCTHADLAALRKALSAHAVWFSAGAPAAPATVVSGLGARLKRHEMARASAFTVDELHARDLAALSRLSAAALLTQPLAGDGHGGTLATALQRAGFRVFLPPAARPSHALRSWSTIGCLEFLLSGAERLARYPRLGGEAAVAETGRRADGATRIVFVLDLIQDFEILRPFVLRAAQTDSPLAPCVAITERVLSSHIAGEVKRLLDALGVPWFKPIGAVDVAMALGDGRAVLASAAESSANGHAFAHACCRIAPPRTLRVTFQHGYECVGLRHHRAHDLQFPQGVRMASDIIFTWRASDELPDLQGSERHRALAVGVTKASAERATTLLQAAWLGDTAPVQGEPSAPGSLIVAENLHSVRFASPLRYRRFLQFVLDVAARSDLNCLIRSHPGKRTLEKTHGRGSFSFLEGVLSADHFSASRGLVSPPSTILLDAALCARPAAVWSDAAVLGDVQNYAALPVVTDAADLDAALLADPDAQGLRSLAWAVDNTSALNGAPAAWQHLCTLAA